MPRQNVDGDEGVVGAEAGLEDGGGAAAQGGAGGGDELGLRLVGQVYENAVGIPTPGELADLGALVEAVLEDLIGLELDGQRLVDFPPEESMALEAGYETGLG